MNLLKRYSTQVSIVILVFLVSPLALYADTNAKICDPNVSSKICNPINASSITELIQIILIGIFKIGMPIIALAIIYCGFLFVSAQGKPEAITKAKSALLYTLIGAAILLGSWALAKLISETVLAL